MNNVINGKGEPTDLKIYDILKCFDAMWFKKAMNDLYDANVNDDNFSILCDLNKKAKIAIKTPVGITKRENFDQIIMQGGVWGPLQCSVQVDQIGKECLENGKYLYKYKECVDIPPLAMIDDIIAVSKSGIDSVVQNSYINTKILANKLEFGPTKCHKMHVTNGKNSCECLELKVHGKEMKLTENEKYLGDKLSSDGKNELNIEDRCNKGLGIKTQALGLLKEISLGNNYFEIGLMLRDSNLINGMLFNSEAWYNLTKSQVEKLEKIDELYLRSLLEAHSKTPLEALYIETGKILIRFILQKKKIDVLASSCKFEGRLLTK